MYLKPLAETERQLPCVVAWAAQGKPLGLGWGREKVPGRKDCHSLPPGQAAKVNLHCHHCHGVRERGHPLVLRKKGKFR